MDFKCIFVFDENIMVDVNMGKKSTTTQLTNRLTEIHILQFTFPTVESLESSGVLSDFDTQDCRRTK